MYQTIHEAIAVSGVFAARQFKPVKFKWGPRVLVIDTITNTSDSKDGGIRYRQYSVTCGGNVYRLRRTVDNDEWWLEEVWCE